MFRRLLVTDLMNELSMVGFAIFFIAFICAVIWAVRMPRQRVERLVHLPLESENSTDER